MNKKQYFSALVFATMLASFAMVAPALANTTATPNQPAWGHGRGGDFYGKGPMMMRPIVFGTVSAINGNSITVSGKTGFGMNATATTFTVDTANAKVMKNNTASAVSSIAVGDTVLVQGTITGTNVVATMIRDGQMPMRGEDRGQGKMGQPGQPRQTPPAPIEGDGQPVIVGKVTTINGSTLTITNKSNTQYMVDATNAKVTEGRTVATLSAVHVNDMVVVQGTVNGTSIVATSVIDQTKPASAQPANGTNDQKPHPGFFGGIGQFFSHLFNF